ncbi:hypothetical protein CLOL250_00473 [Clostridium sp. L2-50]|nr:hypothetical protein CLOL250_00473 [Clostridium sp. L2-50]
MVECEFSKPVRYYTFDVVLIDTWWNVNTREQVRKVNRRPVLIDTWWNVN